jgi:DUF438 domain-containing protein
MEEKRLSQTSKKDTLRDIILKLHQGLPAEAAKDRFENEIGAITSTEVAEIEQSLINEGLSPEEIKKFCNVHALIFQSALEKIASQETSPSHPVYLFRMENREIEKIAGNLKRAASEMMEDGPEASRRKVHDLLEQLRKIETHFERKEQLLFPYLEKVGFMGPSKVMWGKDNEIRDLLKAAHADLGAVKTREDMAAYIETRLSPLVSEVEGMVFKEENILFPASLEKLTPGDWVEILKESDDVGYVFIEKPKETEMMVRELRTALIEEPVLKDGLISLPTGSLNVTELLALLNTLPVDITFVDKDDTVRYFSDSKDRIFRRTKAVIGRNVQNCHPPQSLDVVNRILASFKNGEKDFYEFWIDLGGRFVHIRYFALRDPGKNYLGTLEVTQDATGIRGLKGQKRLLDERD